MQIFLVAPWINQGSVVSGIAGDAFTEVIDEGSFSFAPAEIVISEPGGAVTESSGTSTGPVTSVLLKTWKTLRRI
ncbi:hypothetical protein PHMEG_00025716 [Phytophthora megakarya]|uniref:Uncharacterized protein n=1 Tax=Phytophthora megakarya TaxID=4795 RepID=A0A225VCM4_9STRA|nr:hypothetical protein PHMEG_00025716 [Phytophthora megakarya]